jgi:hypothetical protein
LTTLGTDERTFIGRKRVWICPLMETYNKTGLPCVRRVARELFVRHTLSLESAKGIGRCSPVVEVATYPNRLVLSPEPVRGRRRS